MSNNPCPNCGGSGSVRLPDDCGVCQGEGVHVHEWSCVCGARMSDAPPIPNVVDAMKRADWTEREIGAAMDGRYRGME